MNNQLKLILLSFDIFQCYYQSKPTYLRTQTYLHDGLQQLHRFNSYKSQSSLITYFYPEDASKANPSRLTAPLLPLHAHAPPSQASPTAFLPPNLTSPKLISQTKLQPMIRNFSRFNPTRPLWLSLTTRIHTREEFLQKLKSKQYLEILGIDDSTRNRFTDKDLHKAYLSQIKKFHSDNNQNEAKKKDFEDITKCIISAYEELKKNDPNFKQTARQDEAMFKEENEITMELFNKRYADIKHTLYMPGNEQIRVQFLEALKKRKNVRHDNDYHEEKAAPKTNTNANYSEGYQSSNAGWGKLLGVLCLCGLGFIPFVGSDSKHTPIVDKPEHKVKDFTEAELDVLQQNTGSKSMKSFERFYDALEKRRPHMLSYPRSKDPHILEQLTKYSIAPDIRLYQVPSKYFLYQEDNNQLIQKNSVDDLPKYQLTETKPNTLLTLSLQAERVLQNVYVKVDDILQQLKTKGSYTPPKVLFKYHGYMMVEIRDKPFSNLINYRNTKYISLFDLYFDYYSPIFFKRDYYNQYLVGFDPEQHRNTRYFGNVHINSRSIPCRYISSKDKVVVMRDVKKAYKPNGIMKDIEEKYRENWENYYQRYEKGWKNYATHEAPETYK